MVEVKKQVGSVNSIRALFYYAAGVLGVLTILNSLGNLNYQASDSTSETPCPSLMNGPGVPTFKSRDDLGEVMQKEGFSVGIELGVQRGLYSRVILSKWPSCTEYHLVDLWAHQENYKDYANVDQKTQKQIYESAMTNLAEFGDKIHVCRNYTTSCVTQYDDEYFDFIYVDARHDFKGVLDDLVAYWPKLKKGGIMAGVSLGIYRGLSVQFKNNLTKQLSIVL